MLKQKTSNRFLDMWGQRRAHGPDRRTNRRVSVDLYMNRFLDGQPYLCRMIDLSRSGVRLQSLLEPTQNRGPQFMGLQFQLPDSDDIVTASGEAVTRNGRTIGVRFTNLPPDAAWAIESYLSFA